MQQAPPVRLARLAPPVLEDPRATTATTVAVARQVPRATTARAVRRVLKVTRGRKDLRDRKVRRDPRDHLVIRLNK